MRILYVLCNTVLTGGSSKSFLSMIAEVSKFGHEIAVICPDDKGMSIKLREKGIEVYSVPYTFKSLPPWNRWTAIIKWIPRLISKILKNKRAIPKLLKKTNKFNPDIIHDNNSVTGIGYELAKRMNKPCIIHIREYGYKDFGLILPGINKRLNASFVWTISITEDIYRYRRQNERNQSFQLYNGIIFENEKFYDPIKNDYFFFAGSLLKGKGVDDLIEAYINYTQRVDKALDLVIAGPIGDVQLINSLKNKIELHKLTDKVKWLGAIENVKNYYRKATATIIPSKFEGLGRVMPEAMINGCLCIGRNTGGTKEQLDKGLQICGDEIAIRFENIAELTSRMVEVHKNKNNSFKTGEKYERMISLSQIAVIENFSIEKYGERINSVYETINTQFNNVNK